MWLATLRELLRPQRLIPVVALALPLAAAQHGFSVNKALSNGISAVLIGGFLLVGPWSWRWSQARGGPARLAWPVIALVPFGLAFAMTQWTEAVPSFLLSTMSGALAASLCLVGSWGLGRDIDQALGLEALTERAEALERAASSARLLALNAHLDPHFLFNTLNAIAELCAVDGERAEQAILDLADVLRIVQRGVESPMWALSSEIELATRVLQLHQARDPERITLELATPPVEAEVPPLLLLPLVENAVTHGPAKGHAGPIGLAVHAGEALTITVSNPGPYGGPREGGLGLRAVRERLDLTWGPRAELAIDEQGGRTIATLRLPHG